MSLGTRVLMGSNVPIAKFPVPDRYRPNRTTPNRPTPEPTAPTPQAPAPAPLRNTVPRIGAAPISTAGRRVSVTLRPGPSNAPTNPGRPTAFGDYTGKSMGNPVGHYARVKGFGS